MTDARLTREGWVAPAAPGPARRDVLLVAGATVLVALAWFGLLHLHRATAGRGGARCATVAIELDVAGGAKVRPAAAARVTRAETRTSHGRPFRVVELRGKDAGRCTTVTVAAPPGVAAEAVSLRLLGRGDDVRVERAKDERPRGTITFRGRSQDPRMLVVLPAKGLDLTEAGTKPAGPLAARTAPFDARRVAEAASVRRLDALAAKWWSFALLFAAGVVMPLWLWRRAARRTFSMRVPGPGTEPSTAPPSSLDPVGVALLLAGARPVDPGAAFAGHVLDLVERKLLRARRTLDPEHGVGVLLGLPAVEEGVEDDPAVALLRAGALPDGVTVPVPDSPERHPVVDESARAAWNDHLAARARFERVADAPDTRRLRVATIAFGVGALLALLTGCFVDTDGDRLRAWLVAALLAPPALATGLWQRSARGWRIVDRARRLDRAQWLAWRDAVAAAGAGSLDARSLPVAAAADVDHALLRDSASPTAVGLAAVTAKTVDALAARSGSPAPPSARPRRE